MRVTDPLFQQYLHHVLSFEGGLSNDPQDTASHCAPFPGAYHTNKGVTYCTFNSISTSLGLSNDYSTFTRMTDQDIAKFLYYYYNSVRGPEIDDFTALAMTEAAWGSGPKRAVEHLQSALNTFGNTLAIDGVFGPKTLIAANRANPKALYREYWKQRRAYINYLLSLPTYDQNRTGWLRRINDFLAKFPIASSSGLLILIGLFLAVHKDL